MFFQNQIRSKRLIFVLLLAATGLLPLKANADVRILLDVSQSMALGDPENLRLDAISQLIESLPSGEKAGVWAFGQYINMIVPHQVVDDQWRSDALEAVSELKAPAIRTNIGGAFEKSSYDFDYSTYTGPVHFILVTDGRVDIAPNQEVNRVERTRLIDWVVPKFIAANASIHTIAISDDADKSLLKQLSDQSGGQYHELADSQELSASLFAVMDDAAPTNQIPMDNNGFNVDSGINEVTVLMEHDVGAVSLISPAGVETYAVAPGNQRWRVGVGYSQVSLVSPLAGRWQVSGDIKDGSEIRVLSDVTVQWLKPMQSTVAKGSEVVLEAHIVGPDGEKITNDIAALMHVDIHVNDELIASAIQNGVIRAKVPPRLDMQPLNVELNLDGGTFNRLAYRQLRYVEPFTSEVLLTKTHYEWRIYPNQRLNEVVAVDIMVEAHNEMDMLGGSFEPTEAGYYVWRLPFDAPEGQYTATMSGKMLTNEADILIEPQSIVIDLPPSSTEDFLMTPEWVAQQEALMMAMKPEPVPEPEIEVVEDTILEPVPEMVDELMVPEDEPEVVEELLVPETPVIDLDSDDEWIEEVPEDKNATSWTTYLLLSIPGVLILAIGYLLYRRLESKSENSVNDEDLLMGPDDFADLEDFESAEPDSDLDLSVPPDDLDDLHNAPVVDDIVEPFQGDIPTAEVTEEPMAGEDDMFDVTEDELQEEALDTGGAADGEEEEDLFDIGSIDDDLADLDLALDGDDPFAEENEEKP